MPSVRRRPAGAAAVIGAGLALMLGACTTTQTTAARLQLNDARLRAESVPVRVQPGQTSPTAAVASLALVPAHGTVTVLVTVQNSGARAVSDLPISVGYRLGARSVYLNGTAGSAYFDDHLPVIPAHGSLTWVDSVHASVPTGAHGFARVGARPSVATGIGAPPRIVARVSAGGLKVGSPGGSLTVHLTNESSVPQFQLPVYVVFAAGGHVIAAGVGSIGDLAGGARARVQVGIPDFPINRSGGRYDTIRIEAPATIFK